MGIGSQWYPDLVQSHAIIDNGVFERRKRPKKSGKAWDKVNLGPGDTLEGQSMVFTLTRRPGHTTFRRRTELQIAVAEHAPVDLVSDHVANRQDGGLVHGLTAVRSSDPAVITTSFGPRLAHVGIVTLPHLADLSIGGLNLRLCCQKLVPSYSISPS
jgi:hypothetical protein